MTSHAAYPNTTKPSALRRGVSAGGSRAAVIQSAARPHSHSVAEASTDPLAARASAKNKRGAARPLFENTVQSSETGHLNRKTLGRAKVRRYGGAGHYGPGSAAGRSPCHGGCTTIAGVSRRAARSRDLGLHDAVRGRRPVPRGKHHGSGLQRFADSAGHRVLCVPLDISELRDSDSGKDADDHHHYDQFDKSETGLRALHHLVRPLSPLSPRTGTPPNSC